MKSLAGDQSQHQVDGATVDDLLRAIEADHPEMRGWILDERGVLRRHINVFVNGELGAQDTHVRVRGQDRRPPGPVGRRMTELLVATRKGLFALAGEPGGPFEVVDRAFAGEAVEYATVDPRTGRLLVSVTSPFYGPKLWYADPRRRGLGAGRGRRAAGGRRRGAASASG